MRQWERTLAKLHLYLETVLYNVCSYLAAFPPNYMQYRYENEWILYRMQPILISTTESELTHQYISII